MPINSNFLTDKILEIIQFLVIMALIQRDVKFVNDVPLRAMFVIQKRANVCALQIQWAIFAKNVLQIRGIIIP
jgi:hypothetical protein